MTVARIGRPLGGVREEVGKLSAFLRRDLITAWSYRVDMFSDVFGLFVQAMLFYFIGLMVDSGKVPSYGGEPASYLEFVAVGIAVGMFVQVAVSKVARAVREEQLMGTLESLLLTPTSNATIQVGSAIYDLLYVPIRTVVFLVIVSTAFDLRLDPGGLLPAVAILVLFVPFVWGLGVAGAATIIRVRRGSGLTGFTATLLTISAGAYFPLALLPGWLASAAALNPFAVALDGMREALLGGGGWSAAGSAAVVLVPSAIISLGLGYMSFSWALRRELRRGTLGLY